MSEAAVLVAAHDESVPVPALTRSGRRQTRGVPAPTRDPALADLSLDDVRRVRAGLVEEEGRVSYWRRIVQARLDLLRNPLDGSGDLVTELGHVLADAQVSHRRLAHLSMAAVDGLPPLPNLVALWAHPADDRDAESRERFAAALEAAEVELSAYRRELFSRIDRMTAELVARYHDDPLLALSALPQPPARPTRFAPPRAR